MSGDNKKLLERLENCEEAEKIFKDFNIKWFLQSIKNITSLEETRVCINLIHYMPGLMILNAEAAITGFEPSSEYAEEIKRVISGRLSKLKE